MKPRQALILAINTSILAVLFVFMGWLYWTSRVDVERAAAASMERAVKTTEMLARLRERELSALARSLAASPMLRGALATRDRETIADVLASASAKNGLSSVQVLQAGKAQFGAGAGDWTAFIGEADLGGGQVLRLTQPPAPELLDSWSGITDAFYELGSAKGGPTAKNLPSVEQAYYEKRAVLLEGRLIATLSEPRDPFWRPFERRRNSLIVLGAALFFMGILLSVIFAEIVERYARPAEQGRESDWLRLLDEIEAARARPRA